MIIPYIMENKNVWNHQPDSEQNVAGWWSSLPLWKYEFVSWDD